MSLSLINVQSAVQDIDYENELDLLYSVITLPEGEQAKAYFCFIDDTNGRITKTVALPTWNFVRNELYIHYILH